MRSGVAEEIVRPVSVLNTVEQAVVLGNPETVLQGIESGGRVKGTAGSAQGVHGVTVVARELLLGKVLVELGVGELLEALNGLVLSGDQLGLELVSL